MVKSASSGEHRSLAERLRGLGVRGVLVQMAERGQLFDLRCEMPQCYCDKGRDHFEPKTRPMTNWAPNADHYPTLKRDGGHLKPWNVRLAHVFCNNMDFGWRTRIRAMLEKDPTLTFDAIAKALNGKKTVLVPPGEESWTAEIVRRVYVS
jgi:hypothetical protein